MTAATVSTNDTSILDEVYGRIQNGSLSAAIREICTEFASLRCHLDRKHWREFCKCTVSEHPLGELLRHYRSVNGRLGLPFHSTVSSSPVPRPETFAIPAAMHSRSEIFRQELQRITDENHHSRVLSLGDCTSRNEFSWPLQDLLQILSPDRPVQPFDFIYAMTTVDTLDNAEATALLHQLFGMLAPYGRLLVASFTPEAPDPTYLEAGLDYWPQYRDEEDMVRLAGMIDEKQLSSQYVFRDPQGYTVFLELQKASSSGV